MYRLLDFPLGLSRTQRFMHRHFHMNRKLTPLLEGLGSLAFSASARAVFPIYSAMEAYTGDVDTAITYIGTAAALETAAQLRDRFGYRKADQEIEALVNNWRERTGNDDLDYMDACEWQLHEDLTSGFEDIFNHADQIIQSMLKRDDHYTVLGLEPGANAEDVKRAYRKVAKETHPNFHPNSPEKTERFMRATEAYQTLRQQLE